MQKYESPCDLCMQESPAGKWEEELLCYFPVYYTLYQNSHSCLLLEKVCCLARPLLHEILVFSKVINFAPCEDLILPGAKHSPFLTEVFSSCCWEV